MDVERQKFLRFFALNSDFSLEELKAAYRREVKNWHPDLNKSQDATRMLQEVNRGFMELKQFREANPVTFSNKPSQRASKVVQQGSMKLYSYFPSYDKLSETYRIEVPSEAFLSGALVYVMVGSELSGGQEIRLNLPPNSSPGSVATAKVLGKIKKFKIVIDHRERTSKEKQK